MDEIIKRQPVIILGMHRSGTSLTAQWLYRCGLFLGKELLGRGVGNVKGHFESKAILSFHDKLLDSKEQNYLTAEPEKMVIGKADLIAAEKVINEEFDNRIFFGWKEPRTCLFLNTVWKNVLPDAKALVIFRGPEDVVRSMVRRKKKWYYMSRQNKPTNKIGSKKWFYEQKMKLLLIINLYRLYKKGKTAWKVYNKEIIQYLQEINENDYLVFHYRDILVNANRIITFMNDNWSLQLEKRDISTIFEERLMKHERRTQTPKNKVYKALVELRDRSIEKLNKIQG